MIVISNSFKRFLGIFIFLAIVSVSNSQNEGSRFKFGLVVSPSANWFSVKSEGISTTGSTANFSYGLSTDFALKGSDKYFFSTGVTYLSNGGYINYQSVEEVHDVFFASTNTSKITIRYVEVPVALKLRTHELGYSIFAGMFGFGTGFRVNAFEDKKVIYETSAGSQTINKEKENIQEHIKPVRLSMIIGLEWERKITKDTYFTFGVAFNNGLSNVFDSNTYILDSNGKTDLTKINLDGSANGAKLKGSSKSLAFQFGVYF